jgi:hypothetical protein
MVARDYLTPEVAGRYNKVLIAEEAIRTIGRVANDARTYHYANTLPWNDSGDRILPAANYLPYTARMQEYRIDFERTVVEFVAAYPSLVDEARVRLNGMFRAEDYPPAAEIGNRYAFVVAVAPIPDADAVTRIESISATAMDSIKADLESAYQERQKAANADLWQRLHDGVSHMADKLSHADAIFRDTLTGNLVELCELLPRLNMFGDPNLEAMRQEVQNRLCTVTPQTLRDNPTVRAKTAAEAEEVLKRMAGYCG